MKIPLVDLAWQHQEIAEEVMAGLEEVFAATAFIQGPQVRQFEDEFAAFCHVGNCVGVASGTDALEMAVRALGLGPEDEVIVPANSFIASALGVLRAGVKVRLVDCDPDTYLIDVEAVERAMTPKVKAVMPVHLFGQTAPVEQLSDVVGDVPIIEDGAQSQGATRFGKPSGSLGQIGATSFYPGKNIGAYGDAGAVLTDADDLAQLVRNLGNWGSPQKYHHPVVGFNSRLDTVQAVVLKAKLRHLADWNKQRRRGGGEVRRASIGSGETRAAAGSLGKRARLASVRRQGAGTGEGRRVDAGRGHRCRCALPDTDAPAGSSFISWSPGG